MQALRKEPEFEHVFANAGGPVLPGADPTANGGALARFAGPRNLELR
jgi:hypothetical protein